MSRPVRTLALTLALVGFLMASAYDAVAAGENPCKADYKRLCGNVKPGQGRLQACLKQHKDEISPECKAFLETKKEEIQSKMKQVAEACKGDVDTLCPGVEPGEGRIMKCLLQHKDNLSAKCQNALK